LGLLAISSGGIVISFWLLTGVEEFLMRKGRQKDKQEFHFWSSMWAFLLFICVVAGLWLAALYLMPVIYQVPKTVGEAGDMFGGITALFSGLAFAGLISTLLMQGRELQLQRSELELTREEFKVQRFESMLLALFRFFDDYVGSLELVEKDVGTLRGRAVLAKLASKLPSEIKDFEKRYDEEFEPILGPYYGLLSNVLVHIQKSNITQSDRLKHITSIRSHLSGSEVLLIMFYGASWNGRGMKGLIQKNAVIKNINISDFEKHLSLAKRAYTFDAFSGRERLQRIWNGSTASKN
jgi:hypothetical protein